MPAADDDKPVTQSDLANFRELIEEKFKSVNLRIALAVVGGQAVAAFIAAAAGGPSPAQTTHTAVEIVTRFFS